MDFHQIITKRMKAKRKNSSLFWVWMTVVLLSFNGLAQQADTVIFTYNDFIQIVRTEHPLALNANLKLNEGEAALLYAKGAFDPKVLASYAGKQYNDEQYYSRFNGGLKIPTWFGLEFQGGYEQNVGKYLNPERSNPDGGLIYTGVSLTLGQGLFIDKRRAELKKAKLYQQITEAEKTLMMNQLVYDAGLVYWKWFEAYNSILVHQEAFDLAYERFQGVKEMADLGERPSIDTVESSIQVQTRLLSLQQAQLDFMNSSALLSVFLWEDGIIPLEISETTVPPSMRNLEGKSVSLDILAQKDSMSIHHPEILKSKLKIDQN